MFIYLAYRVINNLIVALLFKKSGVPLILLPRWKKLKNINIFKVNICGAHDHPGDQLFVLPLIKSLSDSNCEVVLPVKDQFTNHSLLKLLGVQLKYESNNADVEVLTKPNYLKQIFNNASPILIDFCDASCSKKISEQLVLSFSKLLSLPLAYERISYASVCDELLDKSFSYILFNNYIHSGVFRKYFVNTGALIKKCIELRSLGYKIVHVGSSSDLASDSGVYPFVDIDLRGKTNSIEIISLAGSPLVMGAVSYDNYISHLMGICDKNCWMLFRGRFNKKNYLHHVKYVNSNFFESIDRLNYIGELKWQKF